jgi:hypothetical protein
MINLKIEQKFMVNRDIYEKVKKRITNKAVASSYDDSVTGLTWVASFRPEETGVLSFEDDKRRYEEVQVFEMSVSSHKNIMPISRAVMGALSYPIVLLASFNGQYKVSIAKPTKKRGDDLLSIHSLFQTFWFFPDAENVSLITNNILEALDFSKYAYDSIYDFHMQLYTALSFYKAKGITKARLIRLLHWIGLKNDPCKREIIESCNPIKFFPPKYLVDGYAPERESNYLLLHDHEEVWYNLIKREKTQRFIAGRRIRTMEELLYYSDEY